MAGSPTLRIAVVGDVAAFTSGMEKAGASLQKFGGQLQSAGRDIAILTAPIAAIGVGAIKTGMDFDKSMSQIQGLVGITGKDLEKLRQGVLSLAGQTAKSPLELADAMYFITSAGLSGEKALQALQFSAKASAAGLGETKVVADAVTSAMNAYSKQGLSASDATDILTAAVRYGKLEASALAPVLGTILPTASALGIGFEQVAGSLAVMSRTGLDAATAATSLNAIMSTLLKPSKGAADELAKVGLSMGDLRTMAAQPGGLIEVMRTLDTAFADNEEALAKVVPNVRALRGVMNVLAQDSKIVDEVMQGVAKSMGMTDVAFAAAAETADFKLKQAMANAEVGLLAVWETLKGPVSDALQDASKLLQDLTKWFQGLDPETRKNIVAFAGLAVAVGPVLMIFGTLIKSVGSMIGLIGTLGTTAVGATGKLLGFGAAVAGVDKAALSGAGGLKAFSAAAAGAVLPIAAIVGGTIALKTAVDESARELSRLRGELSEVAQHYSDEQRGKLGMFGTAFEHLGNAIGMIAPWAGDATRELAGLGREMQNVGTDAAGEIGQGIRRLTNDDLAAYHLKMRETREETERTAISMREQLLSTLQQLGPNFQMTAAEAEILAARFGVSAEEVTMVWEGVAGMFALQTQSIRDHIARLPADFELTADKAQEMATLLGVSTADVERVFASMRGGVKASIETAAEAVRLSGDKIATALGGISQSAEDEWDAFKRATKDGTEDPEARIEKLKTRLDKLNNEDLTKLGPAALAAWAQAKIATESELGQLTFFVENKSDIIENLLPTAINNSIDDTRTEWQAIFGVTKTELGKIESVAKTAGYDIGVATSIGLKNAGPLVKQAAGGLATIIKNNIQLHSPAKEGPWSQDGGPIEWMRDAMRRMVGAGNEALEQGGRHMRQSLAGMASALAPLEPALALAPAPAAPSGFGGSTINIHGLQPGDVETELERYERRRALRWQLEGR